CNKVVSVLIDGPNIYDGIRGVLAHADHEVDVAFYHWDAESDATRALGDGLIAAQANQTTSQPLIARFVIDHWGGVGSGSFAPFLGSLRIWMSRGLDLNLVRIQFATSERKAPFSANLHDKFVTVDGRYLVVTGANPENQHN